MSLTFRQQVVLALLQNLEWMPKFDIDTAAKYMSMPVPENDIEAIAIQKQIIAIQVAETADAIVKAVGN